MTAKTKVLSEASSTTKRLYDLLSVVAVGTVVTYDDLTRALGRDVQTDARSSLDSARRMLQRERRTVFDAVRDVGLKCLDDEGIVATGPQSIAKVGRAARRGAKKVACADDAGLSNDSRVKRNTHISMLGALCSFTRPAAQRRIEERVRTTDKTLPVASTVEAFVRGRR